jgi:hypothetical protein
VHIDPSPQEVPGATALDEDDDHGHYDPQQAGTYFAAATRAAAVLAAFRAPFRGRATPVNAWWGSFDLAVTLFSGREEEPPAQDFISRNAADRQTVTVGWWPGDARYRRAAFYAFTFPSPEAFPRAAVEPAQARFDPGLGEFLLDWDDVLASPDPRDAGLRFARSVFAAASSLGGWDDALARSVDGVPAPLRPRDRDRPAPSS